MIGFILTIFFLHALAVSQQGDKPAPQSEPIRNPAPEIKNVPQSETPKVPQSEPPHNPAPQNIPKTPEPPKVPQSEPPHNPAPQNIPKTPEPPKVPQSEPPHNPAPQNIPKNPEPPKVPQSEPPHNEPPKPAPHSEPPRVPNSEPPKVPQSGPTHNEPPKPAPHSEPPKVPQSEPPKPTNPKDIQQGKDNIEKDKTTITAEITAKVTIGEATSVGTTIAEVHGEVITASIDITFGADATPATFDKICQSWLASLKARTGFDFDGCSWITKTKRQAGTTQTAVTSSKTTLSSASGRVVSMLVIFVLSVLLLVF